MNELVLGSQVFQKDLGSFRVNVIYVNEIARIPKILRIPTEYVNN